jgi:hypothetical protein
VISKSLLKKLRKPTKKLLKLRQAASASHEENCQCTFQLNAPVLLVCNRSLHNHRACKPVQPNDSSQPRDYFRDEFYGGAKYMGRWNVPVIPFLNTKRIWKSPLKRACFMCFRKFICLNLVCISAISNVLTGHHVHDDPLAVRPVEHLHRSHQLTIRRRRLYRICSTFDLKFDRNMS